MGLDTAADLRGQRVRPRRPMIALFVAAALGLLGARYVGSAEVGLAILLGSLLLLAMATFLGRRRTPPGARSVSWGRLWATLLVLVAVLGGYWFWLASLDAHQLAVQQRFAAGSRVKVIAVGTVHTAPAPRPDASRGVRLEPMRAEPPALRRPQPMLAFEQGPQQAFEARSVFELKVHEYRGGDEPWDLRSRPERIRVFTDERWPDVRHGETLAVPLTLDTPAPAANPGEFDYGEHLRHNGISRQARWRFQQGADLLAEPSSLSLFTPRGFTAEVRRRTIEFVHEQVGPTHSSLLLTLTLGIRTLLMPELRDNFAKTGTVHLLVISGLHVGILVLLLEGLLLLLRVPMRSRAVLMIGLLLMFGELTGWQVAVTRAVTMACIYYAARLALRRVDLLNVLAAAALVVVTLNPHELFHTGFHLSFLAVFWLAMLANRWQSRRAPAEDDPHAFHGGAASMLGLAVLRFGWRAGVASAVVLLGLAPLLAYNFNLISPSSLLVNVVALPVMVVILATAIPLLLGISAEVLLGVTGLLALPLGFLLHVAAAAQTMLLQSVFSIAQQGWSHVVTPAPHWSWIVPYQVLLLALACRERLRLPLRRWLLAALLFALAGLLHANTFIPAPTWAAKQAAATAAHAAETRANPDHHEVARATLLHIGVGRCVVLRTPGGGTILVDPGNRASWSVTRNVIAPYLWEQGVRRIDAVVLTEPSLEVSHGLEDLVRMFPVERVLVSEAMRQSLDAETLLAPPRRAGIPVHGLSPGDTLHIDGTTLHVLGPRQAPAASADSSTLAPAHEPDEEREQNAFAQPLVGVMPLLWEVPGEDQPGRMLLPGRSNTQGLDAIWQQLDAMRISSVDALILPYDQPRDPMLAAFLERLTPQAVLHGHFDEPRTNLHAILPDAQVRTTGQSGAIHLAWYPHTLRLATHRKPTAHDLPHRR